MNIKTCNKYLKFLSIECERHSKNSQVTDDELNQLLQEFKKFQKSIDDSEMPKDLKEQIVRLEFQSFNYSFARDKAFLILAIFTFGTSAIIYYYLRNYNRAKQLNEFRHEINSVISFINLNYSERY